MNILPKEIKNKNRTRTRNIETKYGLMPKMFYNLWDEQEGYCKTCEIKLIDWMYPEERVEFEENNYFIYDYDYTRCNIDHDHSMDKGKKNRFGKVNEIDLKGTPGYVRGLLCARCNWKYQTLKIDSYYYVGDNIKLREAIVEDRILNGVDPNNTIPLTVFFAIDNYILL